MRRYLFVCVENSCRSQMAQAFARIEGGDAVEAWSAGSAPSGVVNPKAIAAMRDLGYDLGAHESTGLDTLPDVEFDAVVTMGCGDACPHVPARRRYDWSIPDPKAMDERGFREVRDEIARCVRELLADA
jgi:protein-tyrosine-phosphatase